MGCGLEPRGHVNIDNDRAILGCLWTVHIPNFILADAYYFPFRNNAFGKVVCNQVLEHIHAPLSVLKEMRRVCNGKVFIGTPSQFSLSTNRDHIYTWNPVTLKNLLETVFEKVEVGYKRQTLLGGRLEKYIPLLNLILSKMGFHPQLRAICER